LVAEALPNAFRACDRHIVWRRVQVKVHVSLAFERDKPAKSGDPWHFTTFAQNVHNPGGFV
jgi:hypothetical protein